MFSYFTNHSQNMPIGSLTIEELHAQLVNPNREPFTGAVEVVRGLRIAKDEDVQKLIKGYLLAFIPGAEVDTKDKDATPEQKNIRYSGFMQIDIDLQDNPNMIDADAIRNKLAEIPYIALAAISARGKGVWGLMALAEPERFKEYAEQVYIYFLQARVTIDKTKSKNPTELRYFSPDAGAILKTDYKSFPLIQQHPKQHPQQTYYKPGTTLATAQRWVKETTGLGLIDGQKHYYIFWLSYSLRKSGATEAEVYLTIHNNVLSANCIKSNCISGGITHANAKGIYTPQAAKSTPQSTYEQPKTITPQPQKKELSLPIDVWNVSELERYFESVTLPTKPVHLDKSTTIVDVKKFLAGHLPVVKNYNGNPTFEPYLDRLKLLREILTNLN